MANCIQDELKLIRAYNELQKMKAELKDAIYKLEETDTELDTLVRKTNREIEAFNTTVGSKEEEAAQCQAHLIAFATDLGLKPITSMQAKPDIERKDDH